MDKTAKLVTQILGERILRRLSHVNCDADTHTTTSIGLQLHYWDHGWRFRDSGDDQVGYGRAGRHKERSIKIGAHL